MDATPRTETEPAEPVPPAAGIESESLWTELERIAGAIARRAEDGLARPGLPAPSEPPRIHLRLTAGSYAARYKVLSQGAERTVVLVAVEYRGPHLPRPDELSARFHLTPTEARVALMLAERKTNREIAAALFVTEHTARRHTEKVLLRLGIRRRTAVRDAILGGPPG